MVYRAYKYLYYRIYAWNLRLWGESDLPQYNAFFAVSFLIFLNIMSIPAAIEAFNGERLFEDSNGSKLGVALILIGVLFVSYFLLVHDGKYKKIAKEFVYESKAQRRKKLSALLIYVTLTFLTSFGFIFIRNF